jgi:2-amino-4-hydroxy-6-hydroxymethyldihydropteridine diphosphokinase
MNTREQPSEIVYIMVGSNLGNRSKQIATALSEIADLAGKPFAVSSVYETEPWGFYHDIPFLNQAFGITTSMSPRQLLKIFLAIETRMGRVRNVPGYTARTLDIDILFYGQEVIRQKDFIIPHPRLCERKFALMPLEEIAPDFVHPREHKTIRQLLKECEDNKWVQKLIP